MKKNERLQALQILTSVIHDKIPLSQSLAIKNNCTPLTKNICFGVCREYYRLTEIADYLLDKRPKSPEVWICLLIGLYQLHALSIPDYAVVKETVALLEQIKKPWAKGLVNAILRTYCRERDKILSELQHQPAFIYNHPSWLIQQLQKSWPNNWEAIITANNSHPPMSLRVNCKQTTREEYLTCLKKAEIAAVQHPYAKQCLILKTPCDVHELPGFETGKISVQDAAAQLAITFLDLKPGLHLLDACAAPGGKTCHILESESNLAACLALDIDNKRLARVKENLNRLKLNATLVQGDAQHPDSWWDGKLFDRILVDAPCSATGVIRRHPDIKLIRQLSDIKTAVHLQQSLLAALWPLLAPSGILIYATCSVMPEENELQIKQFVSEHSDCKIIPHDCAWAHPTGHGWQILPGETNMDGFFYSALLKIPA